MPVSVRVMWCVGVLPVRGSLPDMHASSHRYLALLAAYREKAAHDAAAVATHAQRLLTELGLVRITH